MTRRLFLILFLGLFLKSGTGQEAPTNPAAAAVVENIRRAIFEVMDDESEHAYRKMAEKKRTQPIIPENVSFPCDFTGARSPVRPTNVNTIRPGDIDVIGAIGDSLTTANGAQATNLFQMTKEHRGLSWSIGGKDTWRKYLTLPNILKLANPNLIGYSASSGDVQFNGAKFGVQVRKMPALVKALVTRMKNDSRVDVENDWKLITIMIGANDFCDSMCFLGEDSFRNSPERMRNYTISALDYLRDNLPRTIVNLVPPPALDGIFTSRKKGFCHSMHTILCPCVFGHFRQFPDNEIHEMQITWQKVQQEVAADKRYRKDDFLVVCQPLSINTSFPMRTTEGKPAMDFSYLSEDCFHFSQKAHASSANALWNNMLEPINQKTNALLPPFSRIVCPTEKHPYIFSYDNSPNERIILDEKSIKVE